MRYPAPPIPTDFDKELLNLRRRLERIPWHEKSDLELIDWIRKDSGSEDWHRIALFANWDFVEPEIFQWIVSRPETDAATALLLFWKAQPDFYIDAGNDRDALNDLQNPNYVSETVKHFDMIQYIRERWLAGGFDHSKFSFDFARDLWPPEFEELDKEYGELAKIHLPESMRVSLTGKVVDMRDTIDGFPARFMEEQK